MADLQMTQPVAKTLHLSPHRPQIGCQAAGRSISSLKQGAAHAGRCVRFAGQRAVGFSFHGGSVVVGASLINAEIAANQGVKR